MESKKYNDLQTEILIFLQGKVLSASSLKEASAWKMLGHVFILTQQIIKVLSYCWITNDPQVRRLKQKLCTKVIDVE